PARLQRGSATVIPKTVRRAAGILGLAVAREHGKTFIRSRTLDLHTTAVASLSRKGLSGREITAKLNACRIGWAFLNQGEKGLQAQRVRPRRARRSLRR